MNYEKLLQGKTKDQIYEIADNWYQRLNRIKEKHAIPPSDDEYSFANYRNKKAERIAIRLMELCWGLAMILSKYERMVSIPSYQSGVIDRIGESGHETILFYK